MIDIEERLSQTGEHIRAAATRTPLPSAVPPRNAGRQAHRMIIAAAVAVLLVGGLLVVTLQSPSGPPVANEPPGVSALSPADSWKELPEAPIAGRVGAAAVVAGDQFVVWGGRNDGVLDDGAAYSLTERRWRTLAPAPLSPRTGAIAVWTGSEVVIFGGEDANGKPRFGGAAWDPRTDKWREIGPFGVGAIAGHTGAAWTGEELVLVGIIPAPNVFLESDTVALDVATGEPRYLDPMPQVDGSGQPRPAPRSRTATFTGEEVLVVSIADGFDITIDRLAVNDGTWGSTITTSTPGLDVGPDGVAWTGSDLVIVNHLGPGTVFDPGTGQLAVIDSSDSDLRFPAVAVGDTTIFVGDRWIDLEDHTWHDTSPVPGLFREFPVTGTDQSSVYIWGGDACGPTAFCTGLEDPGTGLIWTQN